MGWLPWLALRELWARRGRSLLSLLALALSVGLVAATGSIGALMQAGVATPSALLGHPADLWVASAYDVDYDLPAALAQRVAGVPGVEAVQPVLRRPVRVFTPRPDDLSLLGVKPEAYFQFHGLSLAAGSLPSARSPGLVALAPWALVRELGLGQPVTVTTPAGERALPVTGLLEVDDLAAAQQGLVLYAPLDTVADLFALEEAITALEVRLVHGAPARRVRAELEQVLGPAYAVTPASRAGQGSQLWQQLVLGALLFVDALTLAGSLSLVYAVFSSAARSRRRQVGLLRAAGALRRQVLALLALEATLLGLVGSGLGLVLGLLFARAGARLVLPGAAAPAQVSLPPGWLLLALALGVATSLAGALGPAVRASRQPPLAALYAAPPQPPGPRARGRLWAVAGRWVAGLAPEGRLAAANLSREGRRAALIAAVLALILAMALGNVGVLSLLSQEFVDALGRLSGGDYLVLPGLTAISLRELAGQDTSDAPPLSPGLLAALEDLEPQVWLMGGTTADVPALQVFPGQPTLLLDVEGYARMGGFRFEAGSWPAALEVFRRGPAVLLPPLVARRLEVGLGDALRLDTPAGPVDFVVAGVGESEFTAAVLDLADGLAYLGTNEVNAVMVQVRPGADPDDVRWALLDAVQAHGGTLLPLNQAAAQLRQVFDQVRLSGVLLMVFTGLVAVLGAVNAMLSSVAERRREMGLLRAVGATRQQVGRMVLVEAASLGVAAALLGTVLGWMVTLAFLVVARNHLGLAGQAISSPASWLPLLLASAAGLVLWPLLAVLGGLIPALSAARLPVVEALQGLSS